MSNETRVVNDNLEFELENNDITNTFIWPKAVIAVSSYEKGCRGDTLKGKKSNTPGEYKFKTNNLAWSPISNNNNDDSKEKDKITDPEIIDFIELEFECSGKETEGLVVGIRIFENFNPGSITKISGRSSSKSEEFQLLYSGKSVIGSLPEKYRIFSPFLNINEKSTLNNLKCIRVELSCHGKQTQIEGICLIVNENVQVHPMKFNYLPQFTNFFLVLDDVSLPCHRVVIANQCLELRESLMFPTSNTSGLDKFELKGVSLQRFQKIFKYLYTGQFSLSADSVYTKMGVLSVLDTLIIASRLGISFIKEICFEKLKQGGGITFGTVFDIMKMVQLEEDWKSKRDLKLVYEACYSFIMVEFMTLLSKGKEDFLQNLSLADMKEIIGSSSLKVDNEMVVFETVMDWAKLKNKDSSDLLQLVRFGLIAKESLKDLQKKGMISLQILEKLKDEKATEKLLWFQPRSSLPNTKGILIPTDDSGSDGNDFLQLFGVVVDT